MINNLPTDLSIVQQQLNEIITKLENKRIELKTSLNDLEYQIIPNEFCNIDIRSPDGDLMELILDIISEGEHDKEKIAESISPDLEAACIISQGTYEEDFLFKSV